jgi:hypothetical protein
LIGALCATGAVRAAVVKDDFESGKLDRWTPVTGQWEIVREDGNRVLKSVPDGLTEFRALNLASSVIGDFTFEARIRQVSQDHGANLYFRHNQTPENRVIHTGYWFGISGALAAVGWGTWDHGEQTVDDVMLSPVALDWVKLRLEATGVKISMWIQREGVDDELALVFELEDIAAETGLDLREGRLGFDVAGNEVWIDDVAIDGRSLDVAPSGKSAVSWGAVKSGR